MLKWQGWDVTFWPGGWVRVLDETGVTVVLQYRPIGAGDNLRLRLHTALMTSDAPISPRRWRDLPIAEIEQTLTTMQLVAAQQFEAFIKPAAEREPLSLAEVDAFFGQAEPLRFGASIPSTRLVDPDHDPHTAFEMVRRPGGRIDDAFLENLAAVYRWLVARGEGAPAVRISEGAHVPVGTVHRWIARARKGGFLPPAVQGRAG